MVIGRYGKLHNALCSICSVGRVEHSSDLISFGLYSHGIKINHQYFTIFQCHVSESVLYST